MKTNLPEYFSEDQKGIVYLEGSEPLFSVIIALFSAGFLFATAAFLPEVWSWPWHGGKVAGLLTLLAFAGFSAITGLIAYAGVQPQCLRFDAEKRRVHGSVRGRLWLLRSIDTNFDALQQPVIKCIEREMDGDLYEVRMEWTGNLPLALGCYENRSEAEYWQRRLERLLMS